MNSFPDDDNGACLKSMFERGDTLTQPRNIDYCFAFSNRERSLAFAMLVEEKEYEICLSFYEQRDMWQAIVKKHMIPVYESIMGIVADLSKRAESVGGEYDGWGCMNVSDRDEKTA